MSMTLLNTKWLDVEVAGKTVCQGLDWEVQPGQYWGILGGNGVGKTTLLHTLAGLRPAAGGELLLQGQPLHKLPRRHIARHLGLVFQDNHDAFPATVMETALSGRHPYLGLLQWESERDRDLAIEALHKMELQPMQERLVTTLSGGERRRLGIATLLTQDPPLALLDEPINHLDLRHQVKVLTLLQQRTQSQQRAVAITLHDINLTMRFCTHVMLMFGNGEILCGEASTIMTPQHLQRLYQHPIQQVCDGEQCVFLAG
jgi:iron complex transport system ATP-binding protein